MLTHDQIWSAIEKLAAQNDLSPSALARRAGLDPTTFNKSKRATKSGKPRWPSSESLAKILAATDTSFTAFAALASGAGAEAQPIPLIGFAQAGVGGIFDDGGFPVGGGWDFVRFPDIDDENLYALEVAGDSMEPLYREGDRLIVSPNSETRRGDRVVVKTRDGQVLAKELIRRTATQIELLSLNPEHPPLTFPIEQVEWIARIIWASQ